MATERIQIIVSESGSRTVRRNIEDIGRGAESAEGAVALLRRALSTIAVGTVFRQVIQGITQAQNAQRQLEAVIRSTGAAAGWTRQQLNAMAGELSKASLFSTDEINLAQTRLLSYSGVLGQNVPRAMQAIIDQSARLNISLEQSAETIGRALETPSKAAAALSRQGFGASFTDEVMKNIKALEQQGNMLEAQRIILDILEESYEGAARAAQETLGGAIRTVINQFNDLWQSIGESERMRQLIRFMIDNADTLARALMGVAIAVNLAFGAKAVNMIGRFVGFLAANPVIAFGAALAVGVGMLVAFGNQIQLTSEGAATLRDFLMAIPQGFGEVMQSLSGPFNALLAGLGDAFSWIGEAFSIATGSMVEDWREFAKTADVLDWVRVGAGAIDKFIGIFAGAALAIINGWSVIPDAFKDIFTQAMNGAIAIVERGVNWVIGALNSLPKVNISEVTLGRVESQSSGQASRLGELMREGFLAGYNQDFLQDIVERTTDAAMNNAATRIQQEQEAMRLSLPPTSFPDVNRVIDHASKGGNNRQTFENILANIEQETAALRLNTREREIQNEIISVSDKLKRQLTATEKELLDGALRRRQALQEENSLYEEINGSAEEAARKMEVLNRLFDQGRISITQYNDKLRELRLAQLESARDLESGISRGLLRIEQEFGDVAKVAEDVMVNSFRSIEDAFVQFATTGKFEFKSLVDSIFADITRLAVRQSITAPLANMLGGSGGGGGGLFASLFGGGGGGDGGGFLSSLFGNLFNFAQGGAFSVGGYGGIDNNVMSINGMPVARVSRGETVEVTPQGKGQGGAPVNVYFNISTPNAESFERSQSQILARTQAALSRANRRNN